MDVQGRGYRTLDDVLQYAFHVAGVVGVMMAEVMGVRQRPTLQRACDLGMAFQLTNVARDVVEDARNGRLYLPADWLAEAGLPADPRAVADPANRPAVAAVAGRLLDAADGYYRSARDGLSYLPVRSAWAIASARGRLSRHRAARAAPRLAGLGPAGGGAGAGEAGPGRARRPAGLGRAAAPEIRRPRRPVDGARRAHRFCGWRVEPRSRTLTAIRSRSPSRRSTTRRPTWASSWKA